MISTYVYLRTLGLMLTDRLEGRVKDERGQTAAEYLGVIVVIAAIITALATTEIGDTIRNAIVTAIGNVAGGGGGG